MNIFGHSVTRQIADDHTQSLYYECDDCGLQSNLASKFEQHGCNEHRRP